MGTTIEMKGDLRSNKREETRLELQQLRSKSRTRNLKLARASASYPRGSLRNKRIGNLRRRLSYRSLSRSPSRSLRRRWQRSRK